jgi:hypothetical protein
MYAVLQVMARNGAYGSNTSSVAVVSFSGDAVIEAVEGLTLVHVDNRSVNLTWNKVGEADGYYVITKSKPPYNESKPLYPNFGKNTTTTNKITGNTSLF